jgi:uncharacterized RDD family membrane protein YckC
MWICKICKSEVEGSFEICWNCGNEEHEVSIPNLNEIEKVSSKGTSEELENESSFNLDVVIKSLEAPVKKRFYNCLIDSTLIFIVIILLIMLTKNDGWAYGMPFLAFFYYLLFESLSGATLGKIITKTRVVNGIGEKPHFVTILARTLCRYIPLDAFTFATKGGGWHDNFTGTFVISFDSDKTIT